MYINNAKDLSKWNKILKNDLFKCLFVLLYAADTICIRVYPREKDESKYW